MSNTSLFFKRGETWGVLSLVADVALLTMQLHGEKLRMRGSALLCLIPYPDFGVSSCTDCIKAALRILS
jgi:hypothetical protein